ncbi:ABC-type polysaccharide/polyol phosphate transport system, ATPase component [Owenweeksia hongkongensis DSM 17368]|uniref:ABC-type polysaccharide/polyol phosphate transport system, ATPase component n=1 Tax=Owenweeksia hongkongensis (strain DSM 17368 / CIP 108786 / JCM 12287 / NRRL B-23963 / UST20020801) TaxID=926562 RepID=G8R2H0_OWEHD|nr:ABC transporter ATP-binding protein [Owenweeksia hongkongensis]AEV33982.1 ABC-type polysaccharide/polyol phosphate transport system, ATPase component [Owenweeksia hongkongensis DSM 17368]
MIEEFGIHIKDLVKEYEINKGGNKRKFKALQGVSYSVKRGKITGIIGSNGSGKSTLLKILSRITYPTSGSVEITGNVASLLEVGTGFHPELSGRQNIFLNGSILGMSRSEIKAKFDDIINFSGVADFIDTPVKHYSSGMYVRLAFSVAANLTPDILLVDEVLAVGDATFQQKCLEKMNDASTKDHRTVVFVSHNMSAVRQLCDEVIWLKEGQIVQVGSPDEITAAYLQSMDILSKELPIGLRTDRKGVGGAKITKLQWKNQEELLQSGKPAALEIEYEATEMQEIANLNFRLNIFNENGEYLTSLSNQMANFPFQQVAAKGRSVCRFDRLPLAEGSYYITTNLFINGIKCDRVERALSFKVIQGDYYGAGLTSFRDSPGVFIDQDWIYGKEL